MSQNWNSAKVRAGWRAGLLTFLWPLFSACHGEFWQDDLLPGPSGTYQDCAFFGRL
jgi:hypothetical protein